MPTKRVKAGITRFDIQSRGTKGFMERIYRKGEMHTKFFSDKECGGKTKALKMARSFYDKLLKKLPAPSTSKGVMSSLNSTGLVGVHVAVNPSEYWEDVEYSSYVASWKSDKGERCKISFSVQKYGKKKALALAVIAREKGLKNRDKIEKIYESGPKKKVTKKKATKKSKKKSKR